MENSNVPADASERSIEKLLLKSFNMTVDIRTPQSDKMYDMYRTTSRIIYYQLCLDQLVLPPEVSNEMSCRTLLLVRARVLVPQCLIVMKMDSSM